MIAGAYSADCLTLVSIGQLVDMYRVRELRQSLLVPTPETELGERILLNA